MDSFDISIKGTRGVLYAEFPSIKIETDEGILLETDSLLSVTTHGKERLKIVWEDDSRYNIIIRVLSEPVEHVYKTLTPFVTMIQ